MSSPLLIDLVTIFPGMLRGVLEESMIGRAVAAGLVNIRFINPRDFTNDVHRTADDRPYGGGPGMLMKPEPIFAAVESVRTENSRVILMTPQGEAFKQVKARELANVGHLILISGHYEGVDERIRQHIVTDEISIGDYVLTNGTIAAGVLIDAVVRLLPGALGAEEATRQDSFTEGLLEFPQYTRPQLFRDMEVPEILLSGDHEKIAAWRRKQAELRTRERRPDLCDD